ncbi:MAG: hypothetical protein HPY69_14570 [Armatimonadetes bacterium]|nr:hypothetical protein [Armatimonadota bacterium]
MATGGRGRPNTATAPDRSWWRLSRVDAVGAALGLGLGFLAAGPLLWLAAEARRIQNFELTPAGRFAPGQLVALWLVSSVLGSLLAALLARALVGPAGASPRPWWHGVTMMAAGSLVVVVAAPLLPALLLGLLASSRHLALDLYLLAGSFVGWQSGLIAFVFLYTFRWLEQIRRAREVVP